MKKLLLIAVLACAPLAASASEHSGKILNYLGEGVNSAVLTVTWGDDTALDNLTEGVRFNGTATAASIINKALKADPRFYALAVDGVGPVAYGFDTNGDNSASVTIGEITTPLAEGGILTINFDTDYSAATGTTQYDHWCVNTTDKKWIILINGQIAGKSDPVSDGDDVLLTYAGEMPEYYFYLRPADVYGVWLPETIHVKDAQKNKMTRFKTLTTEAPELETTMRQFLFTDDEGHEVKKAFSFMGGAKGKQEFIIKNNTPCNLNVAVGIRAMENGEKKVIYGNTAKIIVHFDVAVTDFSLEGIEENSVIELDNMGVLPVNPIFEPEDAIDKNIIVNFDDTRIATFYANVLTIVAHHEGTTTMTVGVASSDKTKKYTIKVKGIDPDNKPESFDHGKIWLNEEWFTHTSGSLNFIGPDGKIYYRAYGNQNDNMAFGATSQYGTVYAGKLIVMSKQDWDKGDTRERGENPRSGGRVVVADAKTFKHIGQLDDIGGDGRACVGINPSKMYLGTSEGVRVFDLENIAVAEEDIEDTAPAWDAQIGDMVKAGDYVFVTEVNNSVMIIDIRIDKLVKRIEFEKVQGVVQGADGRVWVGCPNSLTPIDPVSLEVGKTYEIKGGITCTPMMWRHVNIMATTNSNELLWGSGTFYRWNLDTQEDPSSLDPVFTYDRSYSAPYGAPGYDEETDTYMFSSCPGAGLPAVLNWYHFHDASNGSLKHRVQLPVYWWFPAMVINTDRYAPEISLDDILLPDNTPVSIDLKEYVTDKDNIDYNISVSLGAETAATDDDEAVGIALNDKTLTLTPLKEGEKTFTLVAESNGVVTSKTITAKVSDTSGLSGISSAGNPTYEIFTLTGVRVASGITLPAAGLAPGVYVARSSDGKALKLTIR